MKKYADRAGAAATIHHLRPLRARVMLNNGAELSEVQDLLGHASPETTKKIDVPYTKPHLRDAFDRCSLPPEDLARRAVQPHHHPDYGVGPLVHSASREVRYDLPGEPPCTRIRLCPYPLCRFVGTSLEVALAAAPAAVTFGPVLLYSR